MNQFRADSVCGRLRAAIATHPSPPDTGVVAAQVGLARHEASRSLTRMRRMGYVRQVSEATVGRYARPATWAVTGSPERSGIDTP